MRTNFNNLSFTGKFHSHITIGSKDPDLLTQITKEFKGKLTVIDLVNGNRAERDYMITNHFVTGYHDLKNSKDILDYLNSKSLLVKHKFGAPTTRIKLEHELN